MCKYTLENDFGEKCKDDAFDIDNWLGASGIFVQLTYVYTCIYILGRDAEIPLVLQFIRSEEESSFTSILPLT